MSVVDREGTLSGSSWLSAAPGATRVGVLGSFLPMTSNGPSANLARAAEVHHFLLPRFPFYSGLGCCPRRAWPKFFLPHPMPGGDVGTVFM
jgi:hypothetical protein